MSQESITVICCYNQIDQFVELEKDLQFQDVAIQLLAVDNRNHEYSSISAAYNSVVAKASERRVVFLHQDVRLPERDMLRKFITYIDLIGPDDLVGIAGAAKGINHTMSNIYTGNPPKKMTGYPVSGLIPCDTLDECFFGGYTDHFVGHPFNEDLCDNWHLYAVERCLNARMNGAKVYVCDISIVHLSNGKISHGFNKNFLRICKEYHSFTDYIRTPCAYSYTDPFRRFLQYLRLEIRVIRRRT